jgi:hypothetical protein
MVFPLLAFRSDDAVVIASIVVTKSPANYVFVHDLFSGISGNPMRKF